MREGYKKTEVGVIPEDWEVKKLGDISVGKGQYGIGASATEYIDGNPRYLRITDIGDYSKLLYSDIKGLDDSNYKDYILKEHDIVFARTGNTTGKSYVYNKEHGMLVYAGFLIKFTIDKTVANENFIKYIIQSKRYWDWVKVMSTRSGQPGINSNEYSNFKIQLPPLKEQEKIAEIFSTVDSQIDDIEKLIEKSKELKKGLMQKLLTKGIGHSEFKKTEAGEIPASWEVYRFFDIIEKIIDFRGRTPKKLGLDWGNGDILALSANNVKMGKIDFEIENYFGSDKLYEKWMSGNELCKNDILLTMEAPLGNVSLVPDDNKYILSQRVVALKTKDMIDNRYMLYMLMSDTIQNQFNMLSTGTTAKGINQKNLAKVKVIVPPLKEQIKIAAILSSIDSEIEEYEDKKQKLEELKKGLMQQLLTGKIRTV